MSTDGAYYKSKQMVPSIYDIWEVGGNRGDSVTPATWSREYQDMIISVITRYALQTENRRIISLGCGNAMVEGRLVSQGLSVFGIDINPEAITYARKKNLSAAVVDFFDYSPEDGEKFDVIYADGFFGHLYDSGGGELTHAFERIVKHIAARSAFVIASNDAPRLSSSAVESHPSVPNFHFLSADYLVDEAEKAGLTRVEANNYYYTRPISGLCRRSIAIMRI